VAEISNLLRSLPAARPEWLTEYIYQKIFELTLAAPFKIYRALSQLPGGIMNRGLVYDILRYVYFPGYDAVRRA
jgi:hypothetical protein